MIRIEVEGLTELRQRFADFPRKFTAGMRKALEASLLVLWENVPPYPSRQSDYRRTGTLGRTLGVGESGGREGKPDIYQVIKLGGDMDAGEFGTRLDYARYVIGDGEQAWFHQPYWWTMSDIAEGAEDKIIQVFDQLAEALAAWLDRNASI